MVYSLSDELRYKLSLPGKGLLSLEDVEQVLVPHGFVFCSQRDAPDFITAWLSEGRITQWVALIYRKPQDAKAMIRALWFIGFSTDPVSDENPKTGALEAVYRAVLAVLARFPCLFLVPDV